MGSSDAHVSSSLVIYVDVGGTVAEAEADAELAESVGHRSDRRDNLVHIPAQAEDAAMYSLFVDVAEAGLDCGLVEVEVRWVCRIVFVGAVGAVEQPRVEIGLPIDTQREWRAYQEPSTLIGSAIVVVVHVVVD